ncbi:MAG: HAD family hydrolase [Dehalococcoidales bacterium]|nr:HAD family hydrolase [Dehalococcoidales bacterium]
MKYRAVIFDLFGTLIDKFSLRETMGTRRRMASVLGIPDDDFIRLWFGTFNEQDLGVLQSIDATLEHICERFGVHPEDAQLKLAARIELDYDAQSIRPRSNATEVLSHLRSHGYKTGLVSNCSAWIPRILKDMPFALLIDVAVFSSLVGIPKPDRRIYVMAAEQLAVEPRHCLYVGDGDYQELTGAAQAGMHPVLIRDPDEDSTDVHRVGWEAEEWAGPTISSLREVLDLVSLT